MTEQRPTSTNGAEAFPPDSRYRAGESSSRPKYSRVFIKLGGEMFGGGQIGWQYRARWRVRGSER
jgi:uridylate kinase